MKKKISLLLSAALAAAAFTGCGAGNSKAEQTNGQLRIHIGPYQGSYLSEAIAEYQRRYPEVEVLLDDQNEGSWSEDISSVSAALMAGRGPDVLYDPPAYFQDIDKTMNTGVFADLAAFVERDFAEGELNGRVLAAGRRNGRQYIMPITYNIPLLLSTEEILAEAGIDPGQCRESHLALMEQVNAYTARTGNEPPIYSRPLFGLYYPDLLGLPLLDYEKKTADFSDPAFRRAAELYKEFYPYDFTMDDDMVSTPMDGYMGLSQGLAVFESYDFNTGDELFWNAAAIMDKGTPVLVPMVGQDGKPSAWIYKSAAVSSNSPNQENAWNFLKILLSPEMQNSGWNALNLPVRVSCVADRIASSREDAGELVDVDETHSVAMQALPETFYDDFVSIVDQIGHVSYTYAYASMQAFQYLEPYYKDERSLDACLEELTGAVNIYLTE